MCCDLGELVLVDIVALRPVSLFFVIAFFFFFI